MTAQPNVENPVVTLENPWRISDQSRLGRPFAKDPCVVDFKGRTLLYYSVPANPGNGWGIGILESKDLINWAKVGQLEAEQLLTWRHSLQADDAARVGPSNVCGLDGSDTIDDGAARFTPASGYGTYLLLAYHLLGVPAKFRAAQEIVYNAMVRDDALLPRDKEKTDGTVSPRYLVNSRSHRGTLVRRDLLATAPNGRFDLTEAGQHFLQEWIKALGKNLDQYRIGIEDVNPVLFGHRKKPKQINQSVTSEVRSGPK